MKNKMDTMQELFDTLNDQNKELMLWIAKHMQSFQQSPQSERGTDHTDLRLPQ